MEPIAEPLARPLAEPVAARHELEATVLPKTLHLRLTWRTAIASSHGSCPEGPSKLCHHLKSTKLSLEGPC